MSKTTTSSRTGKRLEPLRPMTEAEVMAAALADPDAKPLTPDDFKRMKRIPRAKIIRRALGLTQEGFPPGFGFRSARCAIGSRARPSQTRLHAPISRSSPAIQRRLQMRSRHKGIARPLSNAPPLLRRNSC
jgi:hypothetical protein